MVGFGKSAAPSGDAAVGAANYITGSVAHIAGQDLSLESSAITMSDITYVPLPPSASNPPLPLINGKPVARVSDGGPVFASSIVAPGEQATISGHTVSVGISDVVIDGSRYTLPTHTARKPERSLVTFDDGVVASPTGDPNDLQTGDQYNSVYQPAITISGTAVWLASPELHISSLVPPFQAGTGSSSAGLGNLSVSASQDGHRSAAGNASSGFECCRLHWWDIEILSSSSIIYCLDTRNGSLHDYTSGVVNAVLTLGRDGG